MNMAVDDELIRRNPCRIKGADRYDVPERPVLTIAEVFAVADSIVPRYRLLVLLAEFTTLRFGELAALRRRDINLEALTVSVRRSQAELQHGRLFDKAPKSAAGVRAISLPAELLDDVTRHLEQFAAPGRDGHVFIGPQEANSGEAISAMTGCRPGRRRASCRNSTSTIFATRATPWPRPPVPAPVS